VGGKPFNSFPAFIPVTFELTVLFAGLFTVAAFLLRSKSFPGSKREALPRVTDDRFVLALRADESDAKVKALLEIHGALEVEQMEVAS
jgi:hypothetical protein